MPSFALTFLEGVENTFKPNQLSRTINELRNELSTVRCTPICIREEVHHGNREGEGDKSFRVINSFIVKIDSCPPKNTYI